MRLMFQMMNEARIEVGVQGAAVADAAYQEALDYAKERLQGATGIRRQAPATPRCRSSSTPTCGGCCSPPKAYVEGMRAMLIFQRRLLRRPGPRRREARSASATSSLLELLTPICKAWSSDMGFRVTEWALQIFGGYGYTARLPGRAVPARLQDRLDLRGHQRHPGARPRRPQAAGRAAARRSASSWGWPRRRRRSSPATTSWGSRRGSWGTRSARSARSSARCRGATTGVCW